MIQPLKYIIGLGVLGLLAGCASTSGPKDFGALQYTGFTEKSDGTTYQSVLGLTCPAEIDGMTRGSTYVYNDEGTDVSCNYVDEARIFTVYLSRFKDDTLINNFRSSQYSLENRLGPDGYVYNEELSETCATESIDATSLMSGLSGILRGENTRNEITLSPSPSAVYVSKDSMSLVVVEEMFKDEYFKVRFTGPYAGKSSVETTCKIARDVFLSVKTGVEKSRGIEPSGEGDLRDVLGSAEES